MEDYEVFKIWYVKEFGEDIPDPLEYIALRDTLDFQRFLLGYRYKQLKETIREEVCKSFEKIIEILKKWGTKSDSN